MRSVKLKKYKNREWLKNQYLNLEQSSSQIAKKCNTSKTTILRWLKKFEIKIRNKSEVMKITIKQGRGTPFKKGNNYGRIYGFKKGNRFGNQFKKGSENAYWKGDKVNYQSLHNYITKYKSKTNKCEICGEIKKLQLSFDHSLGRHTRNIDDYKWLCSKCHFERDGKLRNKKGQFIKVKL